tara:strand:+ start:462 stop:1097 length:636 start_codon:yes stop_codon:yes gene_type:complete
MRVLICGRGASLKHIQHEKLANKFEYVFLVNEFNIFVRKNKELAKFLKEQKIIQQINICQTGVDNYLVENFNIEKIYISRLKPDGSQSKWRQASLSPVIKSYDVESGYQPDELEPHMEIVKNSSDIAILNAVVNYGATEVYTIGIDFYESQYFLGMNESDFHACSSEPVKNKIKNSHTKIISKFPDVSFTYITTANFNPELPNFELVKVGE